MSTDRHPIAQCIASAGYGTETYDPETGECTYSYYAGVDVVESNAAYWTQYESRCNEALHRDFDLPATFENYRLTAWDDGSRTYELVKAAP